MGENWSAKEVPDQGGRVALLTGANSGIGLEAARELARRGATTVLACRDPEKCATARASIASSAPDARLDVIELDLSDLESVSDCARAVRHGYEALHLLINNAGVMAPPYGETREGFELQFGVNHLGHFVLTGKLIDLIVASPQSRVVTVSSSAHRMGRLDLDRLSGARSYHRWRAYSRSKLANLLFAYELQRRLQQAGHDTLSLAAHPGLAHTDLQRHSRLFRFVSGLAGQSSEMGALPILRAATDPAAGPGEYYGPSGIGGLRGHPERVASSGISHDAELARRLWRVSEELTGFRFRIPRRPPPAYSGQE